MTVAIKVLIAHGNTQRLKQAVADLHSAGFDVVATPDGGDAFARFFEEMPDIVICSLVLPSLAGPGIARMVRSQSPDTAMVLVVEDMNEVVEEGVVKILEPMTLAKLRDGLPQIAFDAPLPVAEEVSPDLTAASPQQVFFHAVLKRFQRDNRALQTLDDMGIGRMAGVAENKNYGDGERIIVQGDPGDGFYLLVEGQVKVTLEEKGDKEVARIAAGGFFGEMAMLKDQRRSASVWSIGQTTTLYFGKETFLPFLADYPAMREVLSGVALKRTEENLWRVLFDDDEVQRSIAQLGDLPQDATDDVDISEEAPVVEKPVAPAAPRVQSTAFTKTITPAAVLLTPEEAAKQRPLAEIVRERSFMMGAAAGFLGGLIAALMISALRGEPEPAAPPPVAKVEAPASLPVKTAALIPSSLPASAPASEPSLAASAPVEAPKPEKKLPYNDAERALLSESYKAGNYKQVLASAKKLPATLDPDAAFMVCDSNRHLGSPTALQGYLEFTQKFPTHHRLDDAQFWAAELLMQQGKPNDARTLYEKVAANEKSNFRSSAAKRLEK